eukprot:UN14324
MSNAREILSSVISTSKNRLCKIYRVPRQRENILFFLSR